MSRHRSFLKTSQCGTQVFTQELEFSFPKQAPKANCCLQLVFFHDCSNQKAPSGFSPAAQEMEGQGQRFSEYAQLGSPWLTISKGNRGKVGVLWGQGPVGMENPPLPPLSHQCEAAGDRSPTPLGPAPGWGDWLLPIPRLNASPPSQCSLGSFIWPQ